MKHILIATAILMSAFQVSAQQAPTTQPVQTPSVTQDATKQEVRALSGKLKETYAQAAQQLTSIEKQLSVATPQTKGALELTKAELTTAKSDLEASLTSVNSATPYTWKDVSAKAEAVNERVIALIARMK